MHVYVDDRVKRTEINELPRRMIMIVFILLVRPFLICTFIIAVLLLYT